MIGVLASGMNCIGGISFQMSAHQSSKLDCRTSSPEPVVIERSEVQFHTLGRAESMISGIAAKRQTFWSCMRDIRPSPVTVHSIDTVSYHVRPSPLLRHLTSGGIDNHYHYRWKIKRQSQFIKNASCMRWRHGFVVLKRRQRR
jgi:hypothetical protein